MQLKMKTGLSGPGLSLSPGDSHPFDDVEGQRLIDADFAELDTDEPAEPEAPAPSARGRRKA